MAGARAAIRYAKATLSLATDRKTAGAVNNDMKLIVSTIAQNKNLNDALQSPVISALAKRSVLLEVFKNTDKTTLSLIDTLVTNNRIAIFGYVAEKYLQLYDKANGIEVATVTTAIPLTDALKQKVLAKAKELTGKDVEVQSIVDENIIGGFILRVGDIQYNASIKNQLNQLKREFTLN